LASQLIFRPGITSGTGTPFPKIGGACGIRRISAHVGWRFLCKFGYRASLSAEAGTTN
jgi:hypothetical protein